MYFFNISLFIVTMFLLSDIFSISKNNVLCIHAYYNMYENFNEKLDKITGYAQDKVRNMSTTNNVYETNNNNNADDDNNSNNLKQNNLNKIKLKSLKVERPENKISRLNKVFNIFQPYYDRINEQQKLALSSSPAASSNNQHEQNIQLQLYEKNNNDDDDNDVDNDYNYDDDNYDTDNLETMENNLQQYPILIENTNWSNENKFTVIDLKNQKNSIENVVPAAYVENLRKYSCELCSIDKQHQQHQKMDKRLNCCESKQLKIKRDTNNEQKNVKQTENVLPSSSSTSSSSLSAVNELLKKSNEQLPISKVIA